MAAFETHIAHLVRSVSLSELTKHLEFEMLGMRRFGFVSGQWLSFKQVKPDGEELTRAYSIASPPGEDPRFALCLNRVQDGFMSNFLCDMQAGDEIHCQGPFGDFILRPPLRDTIFIATGTGISPFRSMLHWLLTDQLRHQGKQFWLVLGSRYERDIYYHVAAAWSGKVCAAMCRNTFRALRKAGLTCTPTFAGSIKWSKRIASCLGRWAGTGSLSGMRSMTEAQSPFSR